MLDIAKLSYVVFSGCRGLGPWGPNLVKNYAGARFGGKYGSGEMLTDRESKLLSGMLHHLWIPANCEIY